MKRERRFENEDRRPPFNGKDAEAVSSIKAGGYKNAVSKEGIV